MYNLIFSSNLEEREKLQDRVRNLEVRILEKDEEMKLLLRRAQIEAKTLKTQVVTEQMRHKELQGRMDKMNHLSPEAVSTTGSFSTKTSSSSLLPVQTTGNLIRKVLVPPQTTLQQVSSRSTRQASPPPPTLLARPGSMSVPPPEPSASNTSITCSSRPSSESISSVSCRENVIDFNTLLMFFFF